jgi:tetratricopeptide (TPR) repeat protein
MIRQGPAEQLFPWLAILEKQGHLSTADRQKLVELMTHAASAESVVEFAQSLHLSDAAVSLCRESYFRLWGDTARLDASLRTFNCETRTSDAEATVARERAFLRAYLRTRIQGRAEADTSFDPTMPETLQRTPKRESTQELRLLWQLEVEEAIVSANRGSYQAAIRRLKGSVEHHLPLLDTITLSRAYWVLTISYNALGQFRESDRFLQLAKRLAEECQAPPLRLHALRVEALCLLRRERFDKGDTVLRLALNEVPHSGTLYAFLLQLQVWFLVAQNRLDEARGALVELDRELTQENLSNVILDTSLDWCDLRLRLDMMEGVEAEALDLLRRTKDHPYWQFRGHLFLAICAYREQDLPRARREIESTLALATAEQFGPEKVTALFHAACIFLASDDGFAARTAIRTGEELSRAMNLTTSIKGFQFLRKVVNCRQRRGLHHYFDLLVAQNLGPDLEHMLQFYGFFEPVDFWLSDTLGKVCKGAAELYRIVQSEPGAYWFANERVVVTHWSSQTRPDQPRLHYLNVSDDIQLNRLLGALCTQPSPLSLAHIHSLIFTTEYHPFRHIHTLQYLIKRLRAYLTSVGLHIDFVRSEGGYRIREQEHLRVVTTAKRTDSGQKRTKTEEVLSRIQAQGKMTTQELCQTFGITRQALHLHLKPLLQSGKIRLVVRGPKSYYLSQQQNRQAVRKKSNRP